MKKFLFVCGGTGGHIFPAVAIANSLKKMGVTDITFAGRKDSMEERLVAKDWPYEYISAVPLHRGPFLKNLALPFNLSKALVRAKSVIKKVKPDVVVATGGYVSLPIVLAAGTAGIPVYLQEQNAVAGVANKVGSRYAKTIFVTSESASKFFPAEKCMIFGNPVRELPAEGSMARPAEFAPGKKAVFIVGGSQGAVGINNKIEESIKTIAARDDVSVVWQVGVKNVDSISARVGDVPNVVFPCATLRDGNRYPRIPGWHLRLYDACGLDYQPRWSFGLGRNPCLRQTLYLASVPACNGEPSGIQCTRR